MRVNVSATHVPHGHYVGDSGDSWQSQAAALAYTDEHLGRLVDGLTDKERWLIIMCADHGDAFGEDGYRGRGIAHPTVLNVPFAVWLSE
ncbi:sulfatase-like hydrolase/transferase [Streptomyces sp. B93]|uniref:sulfatase-like hydrolase/transferase n=1 Tax=Streptomyces sp. B93 TaxID=2824875 RepID=UPI0027E52FCB|nr:sulfatase-like hydrolase/transferase [Streptomyces sp. B93]